MQRVERSVRVKAPASKVYELWHSFERFPTFMENVQEVRVLAGRGLLLRTNLVRVECASGSLTLISQCEATESKAA